MLKTVNAGADWFPLASGTSANLEDVDFVGPLGLVVGNGLIRRSMDGGQSWTLAATGYQLHGVDVVSETVAVAVGDLEFARSEDGGQAWSFSSIPYISPMTNVSFIDPLHGAISYYGGVVTTADGGQTWTPTSFGPPYSETSTRANEIRMLSPQEIVVSAGSTMCDVINYYDCSSWGQFYRSINGGGRWTFEDAPRVLIGIAVNGAGVVLLVGEGGAIHRGVPPGAMTQVAGHTFSDYFSNPGRITFRGPGEGMTVGGITGNIFNNYRTYSIIARTSDAGDHWAFSYNTAFNDVAYAGASSNAYAAGLRMDQLTHAVTPQLLKSDDGGATWGIVWSDASVGAMTAVAFTSSSHGVAVGENGMVAVIDGEVVTPGTIPGGGRLQDVAFADATTAVTVGAAGVFRSTDGGNSWNPVVAPAGGRNAVAFPSPMVGVAVGSGGTILRTDDAGTTWTVIPSTTTQNLLAVSFATDSYGIAVGNGGTMLETGDGGLTWTGIAGPTTIAFTDVVCLSPHHAYVAGADLMVLEYEQYPLATLISTFEATAEPFTAALRWSVQDEADLVRFTIHRRDGADSAERTIAGDLPASARSFRDGGVAPGRTYEYQLFAIDRDGTTTPSVPITVTIPGASVELLPNQPNPFNPSTAIRFVVPGRGPVRLAVYDVAGRHVVTLVDDTRDAGMHSVEWGGLDARGGRVASGVYLTRLDYGKQSATRKIVLLK